MDFKDTASQIALGAAIENIVLKTHEIGFEVKTHLYSEANNENTIASFSFYNKNANVAGLEPHTNDALSKVIALRHTNRRITPKETIEPGLLKELENSVTAIEGAKIHFFDEPAVLETLGKIISQTDRYRVLYPQSHRDFMYQEMRWTDKEAKERKTGMGVNTLELAPGDMLGLRLVRDPKVVAILREIDGGKVLSTASIKNMVNASAAGILTMPGHSNKEFLNGGRAAQKLWLKATELGIAFQPMNVPIAFFSRLEQNADDLPSEIVPHLKSLYDTFKDTVHYNGEDNIIYLFRVFKAPAPQVLPYRKQVEDVLITV